MILACALDIWTEKDLAELAEVLSTHLFGGVRFGGKEEQIRDEVPAVFIDHLLGMEIVLCGFGGEKGYSLTFERKYRLWAEVKSAEDTRSQTVDLSPYIAKLLSKVPDLQVSQRPVV
jgi:hypothetical protein